MPSRAVTVTNNDASVGLAPRRTVSFALDHAALVAIGISRPDATDLYLRHVSTGQVQETHVVAPNTAAATVYFSLVSGIAAGGGTDSYRLHYGYLDRPDPHRVPIESKSQIHAVTGSRRTTRAPFALYDNFNHRLATDGVTFEDYPSFPAAADSRLYAIPGGTWTVAAAGLLTSPAGGGGFLIYRGPVIGTVRLRARVILQGGYTLPATGIVARMPSLVDGTGYAVGHGFAFDVGNLAVFSSGVLATSSTASTPGTTDAEIEIVMTVQDSGGDSAINGAVDGVTIPTIVTATVGATGRVGVYNLTTGSSGGLGVLEVAVEEWDGVADADIDVSVAGTPALAVPCPSFAWSERIAFASASTTYPEFNAVHRRALAETPQQQIDVSWPLMDPESYFELLALANSTGYGIGPMTFTPPTGASGSYRFVPGSVTTEKQGPGRYSARATLERLRP